MHQIVQEHIARSAALLNDTPAILAEAKKHEERMQLRFKSDPSLHLFIQQYVGAIVPTLKIVPEHTHILLMQNILAQVITEWEDINREFEGQLKPQVQ